MKQKQYPEKECLVHIVSWPEDQQAKLEHKFMVTKPCPVKIFFAEETKANVIIHTSPEKPLHVDMNMNVTARETIPVCISLCEPICVDSEYKVGINLFNLNLGEITVKGRTKLFNCQDQVAPEPVCVDFIGLEKEGIKYEEPFTYNDLTFSPLGNHIRTSNIGYPPGQLKLAFPREGIRIAFAYPVNNPVLTVNNYASPTLKFSVYSNSTLVQEFNEEINNEVREIYIEKSNVTAIEITGGDNEASLVEVCFFPAIRS